MGKVHHMVAVQVLHRLVATHLSARSLTCIEELTPATLRNHAVALATKLATKLVIAVLDHDTEVKEQLPDLPDLPTYTVLDLRFRVFEPDVPLSDAKGNVNGARN